MENAINILLLVFILIVLIIALFCLISVTRILFIETCTHRKAKAVVVNKEEKEKVSFKESLNEKLLNFRFLSLLIYIGGLLSTCLSILFLTFFQNSRLYMGKEADYTGLAVNDDQVLGFVMFIFAVATLVVGIVTAYLSLPYIINKDKLSPKKSHGWLSFSLAILDVLLVIFAILNLVLRPATPKAFWIVIIVLGVLSALYSGCLLFPTLNIKVYQPKPNAKKQ